MDFEIEGFDKPSFFLLSSFFFLLPPSLRKEQTLGDGFHSKAKSKRKIKDKFFF